MALRPYGAQETILNQVGMQGNLAPYLQDYLSSLVKGFLTLENSASFLFPTPYLKAFVIKYV